MERILSINIDQKDQLWLLELAFRAIEHHLSTGEVIDVTPINASVEQILACFVTLHHCGELRGCIGHLEPVRPLFQAVIENAIAAAFRDYRFEPVNRELLDDLELDISILLPSHQIEVNSLQELCNILRPNIDGLTIQHLNHKATFLPSVWDSLPKPETFISHLLLKARLPEKFWHPDLRCSIYQTVRFSSTAFNH